MKSTALLNSMDKVKLWQLLLLYLIPYVFLVYIIQEYVYFDPMYFTGGNPSSAEVYRRVYKFIYFLLPFLLLLRFAIMDFIIRMAIGKNNFTGQSKKPVFKLLVMASFVFLIPFFIKIIWFLGVKPDYTMEQADAFRFLSLYQLFYDTDSLGAGIYYWKFINLFNLLFFLIVSYGLSLISNKSFTYTSILFFLVYVLPNIIYGFFSYSMWSKVMS